MPGPENADEAMADFQAAEALTPAKTLGADPDPISYTSMGVAGYGPPAYPPGTPMDKLVALPPDPPTATVLQMSIDPAGQSLVWALTASQHATELMELRTAKKDREDSGRVPSANEFLVEDRAVTFHREMYQTAEKLAGMWALTASVQPFDSETIQDEMPDSGQGGKSNA